MIRDVRDLRPSLFFYSSLLSPGWMAWELYRCKIDCDAEPENCISEK